MRNRRYVTAALVALIVAGLSLPAGAVQPPVVRSLCDELDLAHCLLPFPNDHFTRPAEPGDGSGTGKWIDFRAAEMPRAFGVKPIDPTEWNRNDGFSPGSVVMTFVPGLDLHRTWGTTAEDPGPRADFNDNRDHIADIGRYQDAGAPILLIDATTGERWPFWSELDHNASTADNDRLLLVRPAVNFLEGHRYLVGLRNMKTSVGAKIPASPVFAAYRDTAELSASPRAQHIREVIDEIEDAETSRGNAFQRSDLFLAWDFTVASGQNLAGRVLHVRDEALELLGDTTPGDGIVQGNAPAFTVTRVTPQTGSAASRVEGTVSVPNFLNGQPLPPIEQDPVAGLPGQAIPGTRFLYGLDGKPMQNPVIPTIDVPYTCTIPAPSPAYADGPAHPTLYGHGLLGNRSESTRGSTERDRERNFMPCAINWMGLADYDIAGAVLTLADPSNMPSMMDRAQQGFLNWIVFSRAIVHPNGFASHAAFRDANQQPLFNVGELVYDGNSQGGIMGGAVCALSVDLTRCALGVPGINYSTLLNRSVDWEGPLVNTEDVLPSYSSILYTAFPDKKEQQVVISLLQMLWDRGEGNGYAQHMTTDPYPNTPAHQVLLHVAYGDFQVTDVAAEVEARTIGARVLDTALPAGRHWGRNAFPYFGLTPFDRDAEGDLVPWDGSALVYWDSGNYPPPNWNIPPRRDGGDPHGDPRAHPDGGDQKRWFWLHGEVIDVFDGLPYLTCRNRVPDQTTLC